MSKINLNMVLGGVADTRDIEANGSISLSQGKGVALSAGSVAGAGSTTTDATVTSYHTTLVHSTVASGGIRFDSFGDGEFKSVKNYSGATVAVYPPTGGTINNSAANGSFSLTSALGASFYALSSNHLFTVS